VKNQGKKLMTFRAFSIGFSTAVLALACGSDSNQGDDNGTEEVVPTRPPAQTCEDNRLLAECQADLPDSDINGDPIVVDEPDDTADPGDQSAEDIARQAVENILASNCGQCHGPALSEADASNGMNYINDLDRLAEEGKLTPGNSADSLIIKRMRAGEMPPRNQGKQPVPPQQIDQVAAFIDNERFWPDYEIGGGVCNDQLFSFDDLYAAVADDLQELDAEDALTARYISLTNRFTAGVCSDTSLDRDRQAVFKMMNALSIDPNITKPTPINDEETIFRIDITDYGWDEAVDVVDNAGNVIVSAIDRWEAVAALNPYAVPFQGDDAEDAIADSGTQFPVMLADSMLDTAMIGNLYYALIGVNAADTLDNFILNDLEIDVVQNLADEEQVRAGTTQSNISRQDRVVQRDDIDARPGVLWQSFDFEDDQNESIFQNPFNFAEGGTEAIFTLDNGMFGYVIADADSIIQEDSNILLDTKQNNFRAITSISCSGCHAQGLIPVADEVREIALDNALVSGLDNDEVEQLEAVYPEASEFASIVDNDTTRFYKAALTQAGVDLQGVEPVSDVFFRFDTDMRLEDAAGDLGLTPERLDDNLDLLNPQIAALGDTTLDRDDFTQFYVDSLCILLANQENQPQDALCDAVEANGGLVP